MSFSVPANQTVSRTVYGHAVENGASLPHDFIRSQVGRIDRAFAAGEPVWMVVDELKMVHSLGPVRRPHKTPRALAVRVVRT